MCGLARLSASTLFSALFVVLYSRCHRLAASNRQLKPAEPLLGQFFITCVPFLSQSMLLHELDATRFFLGFSAHFHSKPHTRCTSSSYLAPRRPTSRPGLSTEPFRTRRTASTHSPDAPGCIRHQCFPQGRQRRLRSHRGTLRPLPHLPLWLPSWRLCPAKNKIQNNKTPKGPPHLLSRFSIRVVFVGLPLGISLA